MFCRNQFRRIIFGWASADLTLTLLKMNNEFNKSYVYIFPEALKRLHLKNLDEMGQGPSQNQERAWHRKIARRNNLIDARERLLQGEMPHTAMQFLERWAPAGENPHEWH